MTTQVLALEPDANQADALRRAIADHGVDLRVVADPEAAIAEINRLAPDVVLVGRSIPRGRRDAVVQHAKKAAGGSGLLVLEIPSFRGDEPQERRFLKFGFKKPSASGDGSDPAVFVAQLTATLAKRSDPRPRPKASPHDGRGPDTGAPTRGDEAGGAAPPAALPKVTKAPPPQHAVGVPDAELSTREADVRLLAEVERVRADAAEQHQQEIAALERESAILREQAVAQALAEAEAEARARLAAEVTRVRAETDETLEIELARARAEGADRLDSEITRVRAEADAQIQELVARAVERELSRERAEAARTLEAETARVRAEADAHTNGLIVQAVERELSRERAESQARIDSALAAARHEASGQAAGAIESVRQDADTRVAAALGDLAAAEEASSSLRAALGQAHAEAEELRRARDHGLQAVDAARETSARETREACAREAALALEATLTTVRSEAESQIADERELARMEAEEHELALAHVRNALAAREADAHEHTAATSRLVAELEALRAEATSDAESHAARLRHEQAQREAAVARARDEGRGQAEQEATGFLEAQAARAEAALAVAQREADARLEATLVAAQREADVRLEAALVAAQREADARLEAEIARVREEESSLVVAAVAAARQEGDAREAAAAEQTRKERLRWQADLERARREVEELRAAHTAARASAGESKASAAARSKDIRAEAARLSAEVEARLQAELTLVRDEAAQARLALEQAQREQTLTRETADEARRELERMQEAARSDAAELTRLREHAAGAQAAVQQAERDREGAQEAIRQAVHAEAVRMQAETEARLADELVRAHDEAARALAAQQHAERMHETARQVAEQALQAEVARVRAEAEAQLEIELVRAREEIAGARLAEQQARRDLEMVRERSSPDGRAATDATAVRALQEEVARVRVETEARLEEDIVRMREEVERTKAALQDAQRELEQARRNQRAPVIPAPTTEPFRARSSGWPNEGVFGDPTQRFPPGGGRGLSRPIRVALGLTSVAVVVAGAAVGMGLPRLAWREIRAITASEKSSGSAAGETPESASAAARPRRAGRGAARPASPQQQKPTPTGTGFVNVFSRIPLDIFVGGRRIGTSEDERLSLAAGRHRLRVVNQHFNFDSTIAVDVASGTLVTHTVALPTAPVRISAPDGAEVWVEGQFVGVAPLASVAVPIGTREVSVRRAGQAEQKHSVEVRAGEAAEVTIEFDTTPATGADEVGLPPVMPPAAPPGGIQ